MVTCGEVSVPQTIQGSSQEASSKGDVVVHHPYHHPYRLQQEHRCHRSAPSRSRHRLHHHHHHHHYHLKGRNSLAHPHGHGDLSHSGRKHHGGPEHGVRGLHDCSVREDGRHYRRRLHRSLSPHHLMRNRPGDGSSGSPHRGNRGIRGHRGQFGTGPWNGSFQPIKTSERHLFNLSSKGTDARPESERSSPLPAAIEEGIERLGQLSLRSESGLL